jgi:CBS domain containing-hemolysin-like protein
MDEPASYLAAIFFDPVTASEPLSWATVAVKLLVVLILVGINGFFVGSEFALVSVRRPRLESRAAAGSRGARAALKLLSQPTIFISATQLGITLASLALGWVGEPTVALVLEPLAERIAPAGTAAYVAHLIAIIVSFTLITFLHIVLGELFPKMVALDRAETLALFAARPLALFARVFLPVIWVFNRAGLALGRLVGLKATLEHTSVYTEDELRGLIDVSLESGHLRREERRLINRVFEFSETLVREAMVPRIEITGINVDSTLEDIAEIFREHRYSRLPVYRESMDDVVGFLHSKDIMRFLLRPEEFRLQDVLQPPLYVVDTARLEDVLRQMQKSKMHFGFVVDEYGGVEGIITLEDLLEEIVGDISDEHDEEVNEQIQLQPDGSCKLDGGLVVRDLNRRLQLSLPEDEGYTTVAGFLMSEAGHVLQAGDVVKYNGLTFTVEEVDRRRVVSVCLTREPEATATEEQEPVEETVAN